METADSPIDLVVSAVAGPAQVVAGTVVTVEWTVTNAGLPPQGENVDPYVARGPWHDTVYLAFGPDATVTQTLAAEVLVGQGVELGPGESFRATAQVRLPGGVNGDYRWQVATNTRGEVFEGQNGGNNTALSAAPVQLALPQLPVGGPATPGQFSGPGELHWYAFTPAGGEDVLVALDSQAASGAVELYVARGYRPTRQRYDFRHAEYNAVDVTAVVPAALSDTYYVTLYPVTLPGATPFALSAGTVEFGLHSVSPGQVGNAGPATLEWRGGQLGPEMLYQVIAPDNSAHNATAVYLANSTLVYATFDLTGLAAGSYDARVHDNGVIRTLHDAFTVAAGSGPQLEARALVPSVVRRGRVFIGTVEYENVGDADMVAPILTLASNYVQSAVGLDPAGPLFGRQAQLIGAAFDGPAGILRPGQRGQITFAAVITGTSLTTLRVEYKLDSATTEVDWDAVEPEVRPPGVNPQVWDVIWADFVADTGPTWGDYVTAMAGHATEVGRRGGRFYSGLDVFHAALVEGFHDAFSNVRGQLWLAEGARPLPGALLLALGQDSADTTAVLSSGDGAFALALPAGTYTVSVPGFLVISPTTIIVPASGQITDLQVAVREGASVAGALTDGAGNPIEGVSVVATDESGRPHEALSQANGSYAITGLAAGSYSVVAGGGPWARVERADVTLADGQSAAMDFALLPAAGVTGLVTAAANGQPIAGTVVALQGPNGQLYSGETDADGVYAIPGLLPGDYSGRVEAEGYGGAFLAPFTAGAGMTTTLPVLALDNGATVSIRLRDILTGQPLGNGQALLYEEATGELAAVLLTAADGYATAGSLPAGSYLVNASAPDQLILTATLTLNAGQWLTATYDLSPAGLISGTVRDGGGAPLAGVIVQALGDNNVSQQATTGADGRYEFRQLLAGHYAVVAGWGFGRQEATISGATWSHSLDFTLSGAAIEGHVSAAGGGPATGTLVLLLLNGETVATAGADENDDYRFAAVATGSYEVVAAGLHGRSDLQPVVVASGTVQAPPLALGSASLSGVVTGMASLPVNGAAVILTPLSPELPLAEAFLAHAIGGLTPGDYRLTERHEGYAVHQQTISIGGGINSLDVSLQDSVLLVGQVTSAVTGGPLGGAVVTAYDAADPARSYLAVAGLAGGYVMAGLPAGTYNVVAGHDGFRHSVASGLVAAGLLVEQDFALEAAQTLLGGAVRNSAGQPVPGALVAIYNPAGERLAAVGAGLGGRYQTDVLLPGSYTVRVEANGFAAPETAVISLVANVPQNEVDFSLTAVGLGTPSWYTLSAAGRYAVANQPLIVPSLDVAALLVEFFLNQNNPELERMAGDQGAYTPIPPPKSDCDPAIDAWVKALFVRDNKEAAWQAWQAHYDNYNRSVRLGAAIFATQLAKLGVSIGSMFIPASNLQSAFAAAGTGTKAAAELAVGSQMMVETYGFIESMMSADWSSAESVIGNMNNLSNWVSGGFGNGFTLIDLLAAAEGLGENPAGPTLGVIGAVTDAISLIMETVNSWRAFEGAVQGRDDARTNYHGAWARFQDYANAVTSANAACNEEPDEPDEPPDPPPGEPGGGSGGSGSARPVGSWDPNDKATTGVGDNGYINGGSAIVYTVRFENVASATAAAQQVVISDTLSASLDWSSLELIAIGFNNVVINVPPACPASRR